MANLSTSYHGQEQQIQDHASILAFAQCCVDFKTVLQLGTPPAQVAAVLAFVNPQLHQLILRPPADGPSFTDWCNQLSPSSPAIVVQGEHWAFETTIIAAKARYLKITIPTKIQILNQRFAYRFDLRPQNCLATFTNYTSLNFQREKIYQQAPVLDLSCTGLALRISPLAASSVQLQDQLIFSAFNQQEPPSKIAGEVTNIISVAPWQDEPYFKEGVRFHKALAMSEISAYINPAPPTI